ITPMRDGMNLVCKEYVASRNDNSGVLILSELAGASKELIDAIIVNPNNIHEVKDALIEALNMPQEEMETRMAAMRQMVFKYNIHHWVRIYMKRLDEVKKLQLSMRAGRVNETIKNEIRDAYDRAQSRLILLDYDGTLVGLDRKST